MKFYSVITTVKEYSGCKNVIFRWFREAMPQGQRPYADLIKDYEPGNPAFYATEVFVEKLFTWDEAQQLKTYLDQRHEEKRKVRCRHCGRKKRTRLAGSRVMSQRCHNRSFNHFAALASSKGGTST
jgi:hypothetical protein